MSEDQFTRLFMHMKEQFEMVNKKLDEKASHKSIGSLAKTIDGFLNRLERQEIENGARDLRFDRLLDWAREVSTKTGISLKNL